MKPEVNIEDFLKLDLRVAKIIKVEDIEGADKLYKFTVDAGKEIGERTLCAGIKEHYKKEELEGKKIIIFANLQPRKLRGIESQGMILAAEDESGTVSLISPEKDVELGGKVR